MLRKRITNLRKKFVNRRNVNMSRTRWIKRFLKKRKSSKLHKEIMEFQKYSLICFIADLQLPLQVNSDEDLRQICRWCIQQKSPLISDQDVDRLSGLLREHVIDPDTAVIRGTLGANREKRAEKKRLTNPEVPREPKLEGYIVYNVRTQVASFYDLKDRNLRTFMLISRPSDRDDIVNNRNLN